MKKYGISRGELNGVLRSVPLENPTLLRTPIVRNGKQATVGYQPEQWKTWE